MKKSLDPRVQRLDLQRADQEYHTTSNWITYEVFHQEKRGKQPVHAGIVHAPSPDLALVFAKEQYGRRKSTSNIWVVKSSEVYMFPQEDEDMFATTPEKLFREPGAYKVRDKINEYKERRG